MRRGPAAGVVGAVVLLAGCAAPPASGPPASDPPAETAAPSAASSPTPGSTPGPAAAPEPLRPSGWLAQISGDAGRLAILGDSFAAGEGAGNYQPAVSGGGDSCHRSLYPVAAELFAPHNTANLACSRATTGHLTAEQRLAGADPATNRATDRAAPATDRATPALSPATAPAAVPAQLDQLQGFDPTLVVLSVGGNNLDFAGILQACLLEVPHCSDNPELSAQAAAQLSLLHADLVDTYNTVAAAVTAPVLVLPYPQLFDEPDGGCGRLSDEEQRFGRDLVADLNAVIRSAVDSSAAANVYYVDGVENALAGHGACSPEPYLHAANVSGLLQAAGSATANQELLHPTREGYRAMTAELVRWAASHPVP